MAIYGTLVVTDDVAMTNDFRMVPENNEMRSLVSSCLGAKT